ncbi:MAG: 2-oxoacid:acceptor oxidoreductase family protein [Desulfarculaceae bacterium]|jgi:indolepyruvate ferredoxin oxidoreductase beta subunit
MKRLHWQAMVAGVGGQGVLFVTRVLAQAARARAKKVMISEVHGMAQRGGSVISHLKAGDFAGPLVAQGSADLLFSLEAGEAVRNLGFLRKGGSLVINAPGPDFLSLQARKALSRHKVQSLYLDATGLAMQAGAVKAANVVLMAAASHKGCLPFSSDDLLRVLMDMSPPPRQKMNQRLFSAGLQN